LLDIAAHFGSEGAQFLFLKGPSADAELTHAGANWQMQVDRIPSRTNPDSCILRITNPTRVLSST